MEHMQQTQHTLASPRSRTAHRRTAAVLSLALLCAGANTAGAQTIKGVLQGLGRMARPDSAARRGARTPSRPGTGGAVRLLSSSVDGPDTLTGRLLADTALAGVLPGVPCGARRSCVPGWDLRVVRVTLPGRAVPAARRCTVVTEIENRGRSAAPASEVRLCMTVGGALGGCQHAMLALDVLPVPALAPGATARLVYVAQLTDPNEYQGWTVVAEIDPDEATAEANRANNAGRSTPTDSRLPELQWLAVDLPPTATVGHPLRVTLRVRNKSAVATSEPTDLQFSGANSCPYPTPNEWGGGPNRLILPAIAPRQTLTMTVELSDAVRCPISNAPIHFEFDPDHARAWGPAHEQSISRTYVLR
jgi:CARDB